MEEAAETAASAAVVLLTNLVIANIICDCTLRRGFIFLSAAIRLNRSLLEQNYISQSFLRRIIILFSSISSLISYLMFIYLACKNVFRYFFLMKLKQLQVKFDWFFKNEIDNTNLLRLKNLFRFYYNNGTYWLVTF